MIPLKTAAGVAPGISIEDPCVSLPTRGEFLTKELRPFSPTAMSPRQPTSFAPLTRSSSGGFTLAEVALAMAIFSFTLVAMLGVLSVGLKSTRKANLQTAAANVMSVITTDIQRALLTENQSDNEERSFTFATPILNITGSYNESDQTLTLTSPTENVVNDAGVLTTATQPQGVLKLFKVNLYPTPPATPPAQSSAAIRVKVSWPHNVPSTVAPEGSLECIVPIPVP